MNFHTVTSGSRAHLKGQAMKMLRMVPFTEAVVDTDQTNICCQFKCHLSGRGFIYEPVLETRMIKIALKLK